jgi:hypothetical protein
MKMTALWDVALCSVISLPDHTAQHPRRQSSSKYNLFTVILTFTESASENHLLVLN